MRDFRLKAKSVLLYLSIISYLLAIAEHLLNLGILGWLYQTVSQTTVFYFLIIVGSALLATYLVESTRKKGGFFFEVIRTRPTHLDINDSYETNDYGVKWRLYPPKPPYETKPWADGPFCPKCYRELEEVKSGKLVRKQVWVCPNCDKEYKRPKGDVKETVERDFAAYLRKKGEL
jgi:ribosomal protein L37AE/L43A